MDVMNQITQKDVRRVLHYHPDTGVFTWLKRPRCSFKTKRGFSSWNVRFPGTLAGYVRPDGYRAIVIWGKLFAAHRLAWLYTHGEWPPEEIDHINGRPDDNRMVNLRCVNRQENVRNQKLRIDNTSGIIGVHMFKPTGRWKAEIKVKSKKIFLGYFENIKDAARARKKAEIKYGFHSNHGRAQPIE